MLVRVVRASLGALLLLVGLPLLLAGALLYAAWQHQDPAGGFTAPVSTVSVYGYAVVVPDVDGLLRRELPFARSGQTTLRLSAQTASGAPAFIALAPSGQTADYLAGIPHTQVEEVRLARGPLPVTTYPVEGGWPPGGPPAEQPFWVASSVDGTLEWRPHELRDRSLALVVMDPAGDEPLAVDLHARVTPHWLGTTTYGLLVLGTLLIVSAIAALAWPGRSRQVVYVVEPRQLPEVAAHLGVQLPADSSGRAGGRAGEAPDGPAAEGWAPDGSAAERSAVDGPVAGAVPPAKEPDRSPPRDWPTPLVPHTTPTPVVTGTPQQAAPVGVLGSTPHA